MSTKRAALFYIRGHSTTGLQSKKKTGAAYLFNGRCQYQAISINIKQGRKAGRYFRVGSCFHKLEKTSPLSEMSRVVKTVHSISRTRMFCFPIILMIVG